jgi:hypothetical protein
MAVSDVIPSVPPVTADIAPKGKCIYEELFSSVFKAVVPSKKKQPNVKLDFQLSLAPVLD